MIGEDLRELFEPLHIEGVRRQLDENRTVLTGFDDGHHEVGGAQRNRLVTCLDHATHLHDRVDGEFRRVRLVHLAEQQALDGALHVFNRHDRPSVAFLGDA